MKLLESMRHQSWKYILSLDEAWFYLSIFLLITNQFGSVQKMKLHKGRENCAISDNDADGRLERRLISLD
jgi:hypothetical protein